MIAEPPFEAGALHVTVDWEFSLEVALTADGVPGVVEGIDALEEVDGPPDPMTFFADTRKI